MGWQEVEREIPRGGHFLHPRPQWMHGLALYLLTDRHGVRVAASPGMAWTYRWKTSAWRQHRDRILDVVLAVLGTVLLVEVVLLLN